MEGCVVDFLYFVKSISKAILTRVLKQVLLVDYFVGLIGKCINFSTE